MMNSIDRTVQFFTDVDLPNYYDKTSIYTTFQQIYTETYTQTYINDNYYTKTNLDALLDTKANDSTSYTVTEINNFVNAKANISLTYDRSQIDTWFSLKSDI